MLCTEAFVVNLWAFEPREIRMNTKVGGQGVYGALRTPPLRRKRAPASSRRMMLKLLAKDEQIAARI